MAWGAALVKIGEINAIACPDLASRDKRTLKWRIARPADWGEKGATRGELQAHIDKLEYAQEAKVRAADRVIGEHEKCRGNGMAKDSAVAVGS